jgi:hypothetical protein
MAVDGWAQIQFNGGAARFLSFGERHGSLSAISIVLPLAVHIRTYTLRAYTGSQLQSLAAEKLKERNKMAEYSVEIIKS